MPEHYKLTVTKHGLVIKFDAEGQRNSFLAAMTRNNIYLFEESDGLGCLFKKYQPDDDVGYFVSEHGRLGILFVNEAQKFYFKERIGLPAAAMIDLGPGYETQLHFNERLLPNLLGAELATSFARG